MNDKKTRTEAEWRQLLTPEQYRIMREKGTERPYTGEYNSTKDAGVYRCACCGAGLFGSDTKYDSGSGWPSFYAPLDPVSVAAHTDTSLGMQRTEVTCSQCGAHLGHVFSDGPAPTGERYCINSVSLKLERK